MEEEPQPKAKKRSTEPDSNAGLEDNIHNLVEFSLFLIHAFEEAFSCSICKITESPIIACQACSTLIGSESCTNTWNQNDLDKKCPKCYSSSCFDDLVQQIKCITNTEERDAYAYTVIIDHDD